MEIREPKFKIGDKVVETDKQNGNIWTVQKITGYEFTFDLYAYFIKNDDGMTMVCNENFLKPYIKPKTVWDLKKGDTYYTVDIDGSVIKERWRDEDYEKSYRNSGNVFLTEEEAEFEVERRKIEAEMFRLGGRRKMKRDEGNYYIAYDDKTGNFVYPIRIWDNAQGLIFFDSDIDAIDVVQEIGEDRIKKYIFGVEE